MKTRKLLVFLTVFAVVTGLLAGCSIASDRDGAGNSMSADKGVAEEFGGNYDSGAGNSDVLSDRKLIRKIKMNAETEDMDALLSKVYQ